MRHDNSLALSFWVHTGVNWAFVLSTIFFFRRLDRKSVNNLFYTPGPELYVMNM